MHKNIGYHTRLDSDNTQKISGGSFGGSVDSETVARLVNAFFTVTIKPSGRAVFVDRAGREVNLYLSIDPETTHQGKTALSEYRKRQDARQAVADAEDADLQNILSNLTTSEAIRLLTQGG